MTLPPDARKRLTSLLFTAISDEPELRHAHSLPIDPRSWGPHAKALTESLRRFAETCDAGDPVADGYSDVKRWFELLCESRTEVFSHLLALQPFEPFNDAAGRAIVQAVNDCLRNIMDCVETARPQESQTDKLHELTQAWPIFIQPCDDILGAAFGITDKPVDEDGEFSPSRVFAHYKYDHSRLLQQVFPHLMSLGVPAVVDDLVSVCVVGWICSAEDQVMAYASMDALLTRILDASEELQVALLEKIKSLEPVLRQSRRRVNKARAQVVQKTDTEARALALADMYKRLAEGPVRQYGWAVLCLIKGALRPVPTLTPLREELIAQQGWISGVAARTILPELRNGEAHEWIAWDGIERKFVVESGLVELERVTYATIQADSFARGCDAAAAFASGVLGSPSRPLPAPNEPGRLPAWRRAEALFGTNGIHVHKADFNAATATITVARLDLEDINPCFQALTCGHTLLPNIRAFGILKDGEEGQVLHVTAAALELTVPIWQRAVTTFDRMPFSTFLPANLDARRAWETESVAIRSVAWIAADDLLDALDGTPELWQAASLKLFESRVSLVKLALEQCDLALPDAQKHRLRALLNAVHELEVELSSLIAPFPAARLDAIWVVERIRNLWGCVGSGSSPPKRDNTAREGLY
ncbi:hypothetical protein [Geodermatophilus sp. SYSU D00766]